MAAVKFMAKAGKIGRGRPSDTGGKVKTGLLKAAMRLLSAGGREMATARAICNAVGVEPPAMYHHYGDLNSLHRAAIDETFRRVSAAYQTQTTAEGPLKGIGAGWDQFMHFAYEEPCMCRIILQQIIADDPPRSVAATLGKLTADLRDLERHGGLRCAAEFAAQLLWAGALGAASLATIRRDESKPVDPGIQREMLVAVLRQIVQEPVARLPA